jgi:hypothetical protein
LAAVKMIAISAPRIRPRMVSSPFDNTLEASPGQ